MLANKVDNCSAFPRIAWRTVELVGAVCAVGPAVAAPAEADALAAFAAELRGGVAGVAVALVGRVHAVELPVADTVLVHADAIAAPELARATRACVKERGHQGFHLHSFTPSFIRLVGEIGCVYFWDLLNVIKF